MTKCFIAKTMKEKRQVGAMWPGVLEEGSELHDGWYVRLPGGRVWHTAQREWNGKGYGNRWKVTGEPPDITVEPSINVEPDWHGTITNGEMTP